MSSSKLGRGLAKGLGIKLVQNEPDVSRGESVFSNHTIDVYVEEEPNPAQWIREVTPNGKDAVNYLYNIFPFIHWIGRYNLIWFWGDLIAGKIPPSARRPSAKANPRRYHCRCCCGASVNGLR